MTDQDVVTEIWQVIFNHEYIWGKQPTRKNLGGGEGGGGKIFKLISFHVQGECFSWFNTDSVIVIIS